MIVVDTELSGLDPAKHSLLSIGALDFYNPSNQFYSECRIWDGAHIDDEALAVNGFTRAEALDTKKKSEAELIAEFTRWAMQCREHTLAGQNVWVDLSFLKAAAGRAHMGWPFAHRIIDLHTMSYFHMLKRGIKPPSEKGRSALNSDAISAYVGITEEIKPHNALNGAKQAAECFSRLIEEAPMFDEFKASPIPWK
jgi:DNA polymerase III epsilon subunit-like protein